MFNNSTQQAIHSSIWVSTLILPAPRSAFALAVCLHFPSHGASWPSRAGALKGCPGNPSVNQAINDMGMDQYLLPSGK